jgi:hypothetical protein
MSSRHEGRRKGAGATTPEGSTRREFLRKSSALARVAGLGVLGFDAVGCGDEGGIDDISPAQSASSAVPLPVAGDVTTSVLETPSRAGEPLHRALLPTGVMGYADRTSVAPGEIIDFHISNDTPFTMGIYRLGLDENDAAADLQMPDFPEVHVAEAAVQPIHPGSYVHVPNGLTDDEATLGFTVECWVRPQDCSKQAAIVTQYDFPERCGFGLFLQPGGAVAFYLGSGGQHEDAFLLSTGPVLKRNEWAHVVGRWDGKTMSIWIDGANRAERARTESWAPGSAPLRLAASAVRSTVNRFFDGDLAMPVLYGRALSATEIAARTSERALVLPEGDVLAVWPLTEEKGAVIASSDARSGRSHRNGTIVNHATWQIGGPSFNANVPRYPTPGNPGAYDPNADETRGHGLRFCSDDLYDCGWRVTHSYRVPANAKSGFYAARLRYSQQPRHARHSEHFHHITFVVTKAASKPKSDVVLVVPTNTFIAYNAKPFRGTKPGLVQLSTSSHRTEEPLAPGEPGHSAYTPHQSGVPAFHMGLRMPMPSADPYSRYGVQSYGHLVQPVRAIQNWLESSGYAYDVVTDLDLHDDSTLLTGYKAVIIPGHSEYWTTAAYDHVKDYLAANGNLLVLSGNTMFWRVSFDSSRTIMECRKIDCGGTSESPRLHGETWHSEDGRRGGLLRECGYPAYPLIGLETAAVLSPKSPGSVSTIAAPDHFLFAGVNVNAFGANLAGHEVDCRVSTLEASRVAAASDVPAHATAPVEPANIVTLATSSGGQTTAFYDYFVRDVASTASSNRGDLVYWERPDGGKVVNVGSIRAGLSLRTDPEFATFVRNVLAHFGVPAH